MRDDMRETVLFFMMLVFLPLSIWGQDNGEGEAEAQKPVEPPKIKLAEKQILRKGNDLFKQKRFVDAEVKYKKALQKNPYYETAGYNLGNAVYEQQRYEEALPQYELVAKSSRDQETRANSYHNAGNVMMKKKDYAQAIDAYKKSLILDPKDEETRYNLALAQKLLKDQQQNQNNENKDQNQDQNQDQQQNQDQNQNNENQNNENQENQDQGDNQDQDKEQDQGDDNEDQKQQNNQGEDLKKNQQPQPNQLSEQQIEQLLEAMNNEENKTQQKVNAKKARGKKVNQEKDW